MPNFPIESIIQISLVGLGLVIGLYAIVNQSIEELIERRFKKLKGLRDKRDAVFDRLRNDKENEGLILEYNQLQEQIKILSKLPYHYDYGYMLSGIAFIITLIFPYISLYFGREQI